MIIFIVSCLEGQENLYFPSTSEKNVYPQNKSFCPYKVVILWSSLLSSPPPQVSFVEEDLGTASSVFPFLEDVSESGRGRSLWDQEVWLRLPTFPLVTLRWAQGWPLVGERVGHVASRLLCLLQKVLQYFWRCLGRTKERGGFYMLKTHFAFLFPVVLAPGDLWIWKALSGCYYVGFPFPFVLKNFPTCLVWGKSLIFRIL